jgi:energy-coupling factor transporter ATP-binding protein EcfA2
MPAAAREPLVIRDLSFRYDTVAVLEGLSLALQRGSTTVVLGPADAGKTTLARILVGAAPRFTGGSLSGSIRLGDTEIPEAKPYELMEMIGLVSQSSEEQIFTTRCDTEVAFGLESLGMRPEKMRETIVASLRLVGLDGFQARNPSTLSGGTHHRTPSGRRPHRAHPGFKNHATS